MISKQLVTGRDEFGACSECWSDQCDPHSECCSWSSTRVNQGIFILRDEAIRDIKHQVKMYHFIQAFY